MKFPKSKYVVISVLGPHAGESSEEIFSRKINDVQKIGKTFWVISSYKSNPPIVQKMKNTAVKEKMEVYCIFIEPSNRGGARPTTESKHAREFSSDKQTWKSLPSEISPVTGNITKNSYALVFDELQILKETLQLDLWNYADFNDQEEPILPKLGVSTFCAIQKDMSNHHKKIKSNLRNIIAIGKIDNLGCVWLR